MYKVSCYGCPFADAEKQRDAIICRLTDEPHDQNVECQFAHGDAIPGIKASAIILHDLQEWRKGRTYIAPDTRIVGKAIDVAISLLEENAKRE